MTAPDPDLAWKHRLYGNIATHHLRQASVCLEACAGASIGEQLESVTRASEMVRRLAAWVDGEMHRVIGTPAMIALEDVEN